MVVQALPHYLALSPGRPPKEAATVHLPLDENGCEIEYEIHGYNGRASSVCCRVLSADSHPAAIPHGVAIANADVRNPLMGCEDFLDVPDDCYAAS